ncbi:uncharacterized protein [Drosophila kikkawai]|uniref:Uncharacterized protein isoform X2 n=1 Tax=Drosophila kikkawai TaxID=30033 RepID=A0A6P4JDP2_DROKI|nr:uncharacterized protein LOC108082279 [Drosophila kikkawai]
MSELLLRRRILLMVLLCAAPLRNAPFGGAAATAAATTTGDQQTQTQSRDLRIPAGWQSDWELDPDWESMDNGPPPPTSRAFDDDLYPNDNGNPPRQPKSSITEMDKQLFGSYFPAYPEFLGRQWHLQQLKQLQVQQKWQSPPVKAKRTPIQWPPPGDGDEEQQQPEPGEPRYPFAYAYSLPWKRKHRYMPSISAGAMTNLGDFFNRLEANVRFAEQSQLGESETRLLEGKHPHPLQHLPAMPPAEGSEPDPVQQQEQDRKTSKLLHALRSYRPSQKIRSLVSRNPQGYRSQLIDPSYMWLGLGK